MEKKIKRIICIVGKTRTGKDTLARKLKSIYGIEPVVSYTTRPKRENETDGVEHWFITKEKMQYIRNTKQVIAYTINDKTGYEYCAIADDISDEKWYSYIINPNGIRYMIANTETDLVHLSESVLFLHIVYLDCDEKILEERGEGRNEPKGVFEKRLQSERKEFDDFSKNWNDLINGRIYTGSIKKDEYVYVVDQVLQYATDSLLKYESDLVAERYLVSKYNIGDEVIVTSVNGCKIHKRTKIKFIINDGKRFENPLYILEEFPNTVVQEKDLKLPLFRFPKRCKK